jgi:hypothetical protein
MNDKGMSDRERALLQAARREVAAKVKRQEVVDTAGLAKSAPPRASTDPRPPRREALKKVSPLDAQTVLGWDHPAAQKPASTPEDKWSRMAALMEAERREGQEKRAKARRATIIFLCCLLLVVLIVGGRSLVR